MQPWLIQQHSTLNNPQVLELFLGQDRLHKGAMFESKCIHAASYRKRKNTWKTEQLCAFPLEACFCWLNPLVESPCFVEITIYICIYIYVYICIYIYRPPWSPNSAVPRVSAAGPPQKCPPEITMRCSSAWRPLANKDFSSAPERPCRGDCAGRKGKLTC